MELDVVDLTKQLIAVESASQHSNAAVSDLIEEMLRAHQFTVERLTYQDENDFTKVSLVAKKGDGAGGFGLFSHSDTVPGGEGWEPFTPRVEGNKLVGRGSCDMKGPLAATIVAAVHADTNRLRRPVFVVITADEEQGYGGAKQVVAASSILRAGWPSYTVVAEPTQLRPVYAHKGGCRVVVTAHGRAAHTSTDKGVSANFQIAPFLADMVGLAEIFRDDDRFSNAEFTPPTNGFNMVLDDGGCPPNVTAAKTVCTLSLRTMPDDHREEAIDLIRAQAAKYDLEVESSCIEPFSVAPDATVVQAALQATGVKHAETVPFGTEAIVYSDYSEPVVLGPGNIAQAHTIGEWIDIAQLTEAVEVYSRMIEEFCM